MSPQLVEGCDVFRCDYCGQLADCDDGLIFWSLAERGDEHDRFTPAVYCSTYCGRTASSAVGSGRG